MTAVKSTMKFAALIFIATFPIATLGADEATPPQSVLILYSNQRPLPANVVTDDTLRRVVPEALGHPVEIFSEFLDVEHFSGQEYAEAVANFIRRKYQRSNVGVIVTPAPGALSFAVRYRDRMIPKVPVVHLNMTRETLRKLDVPADFIGWTAEFDVANTLALAMHLHPRANRLVLVSGASPQDRVWETRYSQAVAGLERPIRVEYFAGLPTPELLERLHALTEGAVVFTPGYFLDGVGRVFTPRQSLDEMVRATEVPIYGPFDTLLGNGIVGGYMVAFDEQAKSAGHVVAQLLSGVLPTAIPTGSLRNKPILDWRQLRRFGVDEAALPADTVVLFREPSLWSRYRWQIVAVAAALILQSLLIATLIVQRRRRQRAERAELQQRVALAHSLRLATIGEMTASISHEINQPLGAILSNADAAEMLLDSESPSPIQLREILADIRRDDLRASEVVQRIRSLLQKHDVEKEIHDVNHLVYETVQLIAAEAVQRETDIDVQPAPAPLRVHGDRVQLQQLLLNLVLNAMDAMAHTPVVFRRVTVRVSRRDNRKVEIAVSDAGHGIETGASERMFESFFTTKPNGLGLGLSIVRTIAEAHGGSVHGENNPSVGATFRVTLPEADGPEVGKTEAAKTDTP